LFITFPLKQAFTTFSDHSTRFW